ncbi:hypothetical protein HDU98_001444, partial [Podochytrium sp. JEL0797]
MRYKIFPESESSLTRVKDSIATIVAHREDTQPCPTSLLRGILTTEKSDRHKKKFHSGDLGKEMVEEDAGVIEALHASSPKAFWIDFVAGTVGGVAGVVVGHPLDTVKVRLQAQAMTQANQRKYSGVVNCVATILKEEKVKGLYKGMASPIVGVAAINSLLFGVHGWFMHHLAGENTPSVANIFWAGCGSGFVNAFLSCPMEL